MCVQGGHSAQTSATGAGGGSRKRPRDSGAYQSLDDYDCSSSELQSELKVESLFKQQVYPMCTYYVPLFKQHVRLMCTERVPNVYLMCA